MRAGGLVLTVVAALLATGCGAPQDGSVRAVDPEDVPYRLLDETPDDSPRVPEPTGEVTLPRVYLVDVEQRLVPVPVEVDAAALPHVEESVLTLLAAGPTETQRGQGLGTALTPDVELTLVDVTDGVAQISLGPPESAPAADRLPLAVGQVVLTATSVAGVDEVLLVQDGSPVEAPLPDGALTGEPLTAADYSSLVEPGASRAVPAPPSG
jgi:hypothetical protein